MPDPLTVNVGRVDLSDRFISSATVVGSPATAAIATAASVTWNPSSGPQIVSGVLVDGMCSFTTGTAATGAKLEIRHGTSAGTVVTGASTGFTTVATSSVYSLSVQGFDTTAVTPGQVYVLCLTVSSATATSAVAFANINATVV